MSSNDQFEFGVSDIDWGTLQNCDFIEERVPGTIEDLPDEFLTAAFSDAVDGLFQNSSSADNQQSSSQSDDEIFYQGHEALFGQQLILPKRFRTPFEKRYKTDYFPRSGPKVGQPQSPRYLLTEDEGQEVIIKFPNNIVPPSNLDRLHLQVALLTVPYAGRHYMHVHKFQIDNKDEKLDENPFYIPLTEEHFRHGEIRIKLVLIYTHQNELKTKFPLPIFGEAPTSIHAQVECKSPKDLIKAYQLKRATVAFTLGYRKSETEFVQFTSTTVVSNEIVEKEKPADLNEIDYPHCSGHINLQELREKRKGKKRSLATSDIGALKKR